MVRRYAVVGIVLAALGASLPSMAYAASPPQLLAWVGAPAADGTTQLTFSISDSDTSLADITLTCRVDGRSVPCVPNVALPFVSEPGVHEFVVHANDQDGGEDTATKTWTFASPSAPPWAAVNHASLREWGIATDGAVIVSVTFEVVTDGDIVDGTCTMNKTEVPCPINRPNGKRFQFNGRLPAGEATLSFVAHDSNGATLRTRRHFWPVFPRLAVAASPVSSRGGVPIDVTIASERGAMRNCQLLEAGSPIQTWAPCKKSFQATLPPSGPSAAYVLRVSVATSAGTNARDVNLYIDRVTPEPTVTPHDRLSQFPPKVTMLFGTRNAEPVPVRFHAAVMRSSPGRSLGDWQRLPVGHHTRTQVGLDRGAALCVRTSAIDRAGNKSGWSRTGCRVRPFDERDISADGDWTKINDPKFYGGTGLWASAPGSALKLRNVAARSVIVWGRKGKFAGRLAVYLDGRRIDTVSLRSPKSGRAVVFAHTFPSTRHGDLELRVVSAKRPVTIDAVVVSPFAVQI